MPLEADRMRLNRPKSALNTDVRRQAEGVKSLRTGLAWPPDRKRGGNRMRNLTLSDRCDGFTVQLW